MSFRYFHEFGESMKLVSQNKYLYWGALLLVLISMALSIIPEFFAPKEFTSAGDIVQTLAYLLLTFLFNFIVIVLSLYMITASYNSIKQIFDGKKVTLHEYFANGFKRFWSYIGLVALIYVCMIGIYLVLGIPAIFLFVLEIEALFVVGLTFILAIIIAVMFLVFKLMFSIPALAGGKGILDAWKASWNYPNKSHQFKSLLTLIFVGLILMLLYVPYYWYIYTNLSIYSSDIPLAGLSPFMLTYLVLTLFVTTYIGIANYVFIFKAYLAKDA